MNLLNHIEKSSKLVKIFHEDNKEKISVKWSFTYWQIFVHHIDNTTLLYILLIIIFIIQIKEFPGVVGQFCGFEEFLQLSVAILKYIFGAGEFSIYDLEVGNIEIILWPYFCWEMKFKAQQELYN